MRGRVNEVRGSLQQHAAPTLSQRFKLAGACTRRLGDRRRMGWGGRHRCSRPAWPPVVTAGLVAIRAGLDEELTTFVVGAGTLLALGTPPVLHALL